MQRLDTRKHIPAICGCGAHFTADPACKACGAANPDYDRVRAYRRQVKLRRLASKQRAAQFQNRSA